ncbi:hypothetical protein IEQ34_001098 [Dendrobium chrysotoxum]|uniref:Uncharacterized protein n=1 Tax=Dendrobium chrysotoxum TaxID=161865 RepID=A0AAV7HN19_DENCH|nr:hypothetical protein IEQ34_001098 [Dendrobium chrysotoxum]
MERAILRKKMDWAALKDWQKYMPKFRAELGYALCLTIKILEAAIGRVIRVRASMGQSTTFVASGHLSK